MAITSTWTTAELSIRVDIPEHEVHRRLFTLQIFERSPDRWPLNALALLMAQSKGQAVCRLCFETSDTEGKCPGKHSRETRMVYLPEAEHSA